jgi:hypothetical protein
LIQVPNGTIEMGLSVCGYWHRRILAHAVGVEFWSPVDPMVISPILMTMTKSARSHKHDTTMKRRKSGIEAAMEPALFLTIDLDVRSRRSLAPLMAAWPG